MQLRQREIQPDREQQKDHAKLRHGLELRYIDNRSDRVRTENDPDQQVAQAGGNVQVLKNEHHGDRNAQQQQDV